MRDRNKVRHPADFLAARCNRRHASAQRSGARRSGQVRCRRATAFANQGIPYEKLTGRFYGQLDPRHALNLIITDIELAPPNDRGMVEYSATFTILKPVDMGKSTGVIVYQVPNRGRHTIEGRGFFADFRAAGHVLVASGWQADIAAGPGIESMVTPTAKNPDGSSITGPVMARFVDMPAGTTTLPIIRGRVTGTATPVSFDTTKATLTRRTARRTPAVWPSHPRIGRSPTARRNPFRDSPTPRKRVSKAVSTRPFSTS